MKIERPLDGLNEAKGKRVVVDLKNKKQIVGTLVAFDIHPNIVMSDAEERENGEMQRKLGTVFLRGDAIISIIIQ